MNPRVKSRMKVVEAAKKRNGARGRRTTPTTKEQPGMRVRRKSFEELAAVQGIKPTRLDDILGKGANLWESDLELERFVKDIYAKRKEDLESAKQ